MGKANYLYNQQGSPKGAWKHTQGAGVMFSIITVIIFFCGGVRRQQFGYFKLHMSLLCFVSFWVARRGNKLEHFMPQTVFSHVCLVPARPQGQNVEAF